MIRYIRQRVRNYLAQRLRLPSIESSLHRLVACGFSPDGVYDVGAYRGEFAEMTIRNWPDCYVTCFEPQQNRIADLAELSRRTAGRVSYETVLLGAEPSDSVDFYLSETGSSVLPNATGAQPTMTKVSMKTLDEHRAQPTSRPCRFLKLDVQGYELDVLRGAESTLAAETEVILAELNYLEIYQGVPLFHELIAWLADRGFVAYDIAGIIRRPLDEALWQADFVFVRANSPLRRDQRWGNERPASQV